MRAEEGEREREETANDVGGGGGGAKGGVNEPMNSC